MQLECKSQTRCRQKSIVRVVLSLFWNWSITVFRKKINHRSTSFVPSNCISRASLWRRSVSAASTSWELQASLSFEGDNWISRVVMQSAYHRVAIKSSPKSKQHFGWSNSSPQTWYSHQLQSCIFMAPQDPICGSCVDSFRFEFQSMRIGKKI